MHFPLLEYLRLDHSATIPLSSSSRFASPHSVALSPLPSPPLLSLSESPLTPAIQDPEASGATGGPAFLLKLSNDDDLVVTFTFIIRQSQAADSTQAGGATDTTINGLTFVYASNSREVENLVTREFHADPNLHKNANVELVGVYSTEGSPSVTFEWTWKWKPPKSVEDKGGGWRNSCSVGVSRRSFPTRSC